MDQPEREPRPAAEIDFLVGLHPCVEPGTIVLFEPRLPEGSWPAETWARITARYDERWREWWGPTGDAVRAAASAQRLFIDPVTGALRTHLTQED